MTKRPPTLLEFGVAASVAVVDHWRSSTASSTGRIVASAVIVSAIVRTKTDSVWVNDAALSKDSGSGPAAPSGHRAPRGHSAWASGPNGRDTPGEHRPMHTLPPRRRRSSAAHSRARDFPIPVGPEIVTTLN